MPIYEVEKNGKVYEIDAPTPKAAAASLATKEARGITDPASVKVTDAPKWYQPGGDALLDNVRGGLDVVKGAGKELVAQGMRGGAKLRQIPGVDAVANALPSVPVGNMDPANGPERVGQALLNLTEFLRAGQLTGGMTGSLPLRAATGAGVNAGLAQAQGQGPVGTAISAIGGAMVPAVPAAVDAIPNAERAGKNFQEVMGAAKNVPINTEEPGNAALRVWQLADRGGSMPKAVRNLLARMGDPEKPPLAYEEARDFYSNISRLSAAEQQRLTPVMKRAVGELRAALDAANEGAAGEVGKAELYRAAMKEYRNAARLRGVADASVKYGKRAAVTGAVGAAGLGAAKALGVLD